MTATSYSDAVNEALERLDDLGYERGDHDFANHGPMGAEAVAALGYGDEVAGWVQRYRNAMAHHEPPEPRFPLDATDESSWRPALGAFERVGDWEQLFRRELAQAPWREVLARWWPRLLPGLLAGLTHGTIRTAHAVRGLAAAQTPSALQLTELARGLAYWAGRYHELPGQALFTGQYSLADAIRALPRLPSGTSADPGHRLRHLGEHPGYGAALTALAPQRTQWLLSEMTAEFAGVYLAHPEVFPVPLVHGVTAPAAVRLVLPHLPDELHQPSLAALWQAHTALLLAFTSGHGTEGTAREQAIETAFPLSMSSAREPSTTVTSMSSNSPKRACASTVCAPTPDTQPQSSPRTSASPAATISRPSGARSVVCAQSSGRTTAGFQARPGTPQPWALSIFFASRAYRPTSRLR